MTKFNSTSSLLKTQPANTCESQFAKAQLLVDLGLTQPANTCESYHFPALRHTLLCHRDTAREYVNPSGFRFAKSISPFRGDEDLHRVACAKLAQTFTFAPLQERLHLKLMLMPNGMNRPIIYGDAVFLCGERESPLPHASPRRLPSVDFSIGCWQNNKTPISVQ